MCFGGGDSGSGSGGAVASLTDYTIQMDFVYCVCIFIIDFLSKWLRNKIFYLYVEILLYFYSVFAAAAGAAGRWWWC